jgi:hypothetical protein
VADIDEGSGHALVLFPQSSFTPRSLAHNIPSTTTTNNPPETLIIPFSALQQPAIMPGVRKSIAHHTNLQFQARFEDNQRFINPTRRC